MESLNFENAGVVDGETLRGCACLEKNIYICMCMCECTNSVNNENGSRVEDQ